MSVRDHIFRLGLPCCAVVLLLVPLASRAMAALPATAEDQAAWLGDVYAAGLDHHYGDGLSAGSVATSRAELVAGLTDSLKQPLDVRQLCELMEWVFDATWMGQRELPPPDLRLHERVQSIVYTTGLYLSRPQLTDQEEGELWAEILYQIGSVLDVLRQALVQESSDFPDAESMAASAVLERAAELAEAVRSPVCPLLRRPFTEQEMASFRERVPKLAADARASWDSYQARLAQDPEFQGDPLALLRSRHDMGAAALLLTQHVLHAQYTAPEFLSPDEEAALAAAYRALFEANRAAREALREEQP